MRNLVLSITSLAILMVAACSDPGAPVAQGAGDRGCHRGQGVRARIKHHEIIAEAVHFGES